MFVNEKKNQFPIPIIIAGRLTRWLDTDKKKKKNNITPVWGGIEGKLFIFRKKAKLMIWITLSNVYATSSYTLIFRFISRNLCEIS